MALRRCTLSRCATGILLWQKFLLVLLSLSPSGVHSLLGNLKIQPPAIQQSLQETSCLKIRIRRTQEWDLDHISSMLSTAVVNSPEDRWNWKTNIDRLLAKVDIESLIRCRLQAIEQGRNIYSNLQSIQDLEIQDRVKLMWANDSLRHRIEKASQETGEPNLWKEHNFALPPEDPNWLNHLQMTAENVHTQEVVGFCEVAMLHNPILEKEEECILAYSPAITNLATAPKYRRRGIAKRLLKAAERFVQVQWKAENMGLYVEQANQAAISLYECLGYEPKMPCDGGERLGNMWYMTRGLTDKATDLVAERNEV